MSRSEVRIAGAGGQGVVTAGRILAEAAILSGSNATHSQVYGPQSRGGASRSDIVIASGDIGFPLADDIDLLIALSGEAYAKYQPELGERGRLIVDSRCAPESGRGQSGNGQSGNGQLGNGAISEFAVVDTARAICGGQLVTGVVALGVLQAFAGLVDADALTEAVATRVPAKHRDMNLEALRAGMGLVTGAVP